MNNIRIVLLNGPPRVGKDTSAQLIADLARTEWIGDSPWTVELERYSFPLKYGVLAFLNVFSFDHPLAKSLEENKDKPHHLFNGKTYRQMQIGLSESFIKPFLGDPMIFGRWMVTRIEQWAKIYDRDERLLIVIPDAGFSLESHPVVRYLGADSVCLIRLYRDGCDFSNDSRGYIDLADLGVHTYNIDNNGTEKELKSKLLGVLDKWMRATTET